MKEEFLELVSIIRSFNEVAMPWLQIVFLWCIAGEIASLRKSRKE